MDARHLLIHGVVQGVGYRYSMAREALRLGATGWVRNRRDGTVEALICGDAETLASLINWSRSGPPAARVTRVEVELAEGPSLPGFEQLPTI